MADSKIPGSDSMCKYTATSSTGSLINAVPDDLIQTILQRLSASDLCHVASCCHWLRNLANQDSLWRPLCQSRGWEHYGTTRDLAKIASYGPSKQAHGAKKGHISVTFDKDRILTDENTAGLTSTCRWKGVYMRAYHLDRNWATNCFHSKGFTLGWKKPNDYHRIVRVDGDLLAIDNEFTTPQPIKVYDIRRKTLQCVIPPVESTIAPVAGGIKFTDGVIVVPCLGGVACAFDARTGKLLQKIDLHLGSRYMLLFFDGELVITYECAANKKENNEKFCDIYVSCVKDGQLQRTLTVDHTDGVKICYYNVDYRDKMVAAVYDDDYIRVWDARSGECLHQLNCPGEESKVKLGDNVIIGFSKAFDMEVCDIIIWSQDTGECKKVIREVPSHRYVRPYAYVLNNLIIYYDQISVPGDHFYFTYVYNLRKESVTETVHRCGDPRRNETKSVYIVLEEPEYRGEKAWPSAVFNATPSGLVRLFDAGTNHIIWIDDIRMILIDDKKRKLRVHHYW